MGTKKAMRTFYKGLWFRSKTEAFWASFFDAAGITWTYKDGCRAESGIEQPDFYLAFTNQMEQPAGCWFEVKGPEPDEIILKEMGAYARKNAVHLYLVSGTPGERCLVWKWDQRGNPILTKSPWSTLLARLILLSPKTEFHNHPKNALDACYNAHFEHEVETT